VLARGLVAPRGLPGLRTDFLAADLRVLRLALLFFFLDAARFFVDPARFFAAAFLRDWAAAAGLRRLPFVVFDLDFLAMINAFERLWMSEN
jgi:hypothetical protein